jgi:hypothetical protein
MAHIIGALHGWCCLSKDVSLGRSCRPFYLFEAKTSESNIAASMNRAYTIRGCYVLLILKRFYQSSSPARSPASQPNNIPEVRKGEQCRCRREIAVFACLGFRDFGTSFGLREGHARAQKLFGQTAR